jgi:hypothetical protein
MHRQWLLFILVLLATCAVYWAGLTGPLLFDDNQNLEPLNQWLQGRLGWVSVVFGANHAGGLGRPLALASFMLNIKLLGPGIWGLKFGNLLLHLANGVVVYALFQGLLRARALARTTSLDMGWLPLLGASIWLLHPLLVSTVLYVVQRMAMLSAFFVLLALVAYLNGRMALAAGDRRRAGWLLALAVPICTVLATLSKENGILAPALCAVIELCVFLPAPGTRRPAASRAFLVCALLVPALIAIVLTALHSPIIMEGYANRSFTLTERLLTQSRVLWDYIGSVMLPYGPRLGLYHDDYVVSHGLLDPPATVIALSAWALAIAVAWRVRRRIPGLALGLGIFLVGQSIESSVFPLVNYFEHRNYLPAIGIIWSVMSIGAWAAPHLVARMHNASRVGILAAVSLVLILAMATAARSGVWQSHQAIMVQALKYHPDSRWLRIELAAEAMQKTPPDDRAARTHLDHLLEAPDRSTRRLAAAGRLIVSCAVGGKADPSLVHTAFDGSPEPIEADLLLAFEHLSDGVKTQPCAGLSAGQMAGDLAAMLDRSSLPGSDQGIWRLRLKAAYLYLAAGNIEEALKQATLSYGGGTADPQVAVFTADLMLRRGDMDGAGRMLDAASRQAAPDDIAGHEIIKAYRDYIVERRHAPLN